MQLARLLYFNGFHGNTVRSDTRSTDSRFGSSSELARNAVLYMYNTVLYGKQKALSLFYSNAHVLSGMEFSIKGRFRDTLLILLHHFFCFFERTAPRID